ncbi:MAG: transposase [Eubacteriaceae bacterium]|nr:transposase [Eubacteriaceae bacterium]
MGEFFGCKIFGGYPTLVLGGTQLGKITIAAAMGTRPDGAKQMLGIVEGGSGNSTVVKGLFADLVGRGLDPAGPRLCAIDGSKALAKAINDTFGDKAVIQGCQAHKKRNVLGRLPESGKTRLQSASAWHIWNLNTMRLFRASRT